MTSFRTVHGGGYQFRLCPLGSNLTEACFQQTPMPFVGNSKLMISDGSIIELDSVDVTNGTLPVGGTWRMLGIPDAGGYGMPQTKWAFEPPCREPGYPDNPPRFPNQGRCSGDWTNNITMYYSSQYALPLSLSLSLSLSVALCRSLALCLCPCLTYMWAGAGMITFVCLSI
jgi:hypothetical protein